VSSVGLATSGTLVSSYGLDPWLLLVNLGANSCLEVV
jgi:hypothetical protein